MYVLFILLFVLVGFAGALMSSLSVCDRDRRVDVASGKRVLGRVSSVRSLSGELASVFFHFIAFLSRFLAELLIFYSVSVTSSGVLDF